MICIKKDLDSEYRKSLLENKKINQFKSGQNIQTLLHQGRYADRK
jgi:hypothetical protein